MSAAPDDLSKKRGYHHGNLREALIEAALRLIGEKGPAGFTVAEAARKAGVSPAAPYRHFRDRDELLAEIALRGFRNFSARLRTAWDEGRPRPDEAFTRVGRAYLTFVREEPAYYAAMFQSGLSFANYPELREASERSFGVLCDNCAAIIAMLPGPKRPPVLLMALQIWSQTHGIASLFAGHDMSRRPYPVTAEELLETGVRHYLNGLRQASLE
ncbi:MAG: TetR/AcrR family transcriptional regulator [Beijerinckiaceae bacterium]|jgi:AcrR family transcriptional regulator|nr:TetR/AcrR family transcriptional regulator [Beijerinckiaceae bacterium]